MFLAAAIENIFIKKSLSLIIGDAAILKPHQRHQLAIFVDWPGPTMQFAALFQRAQIVAEVGVVGFCHSVRSFLMNKRFADLIEFFVRGLSISI